MITPTQAADRVRDILITHYSTALTEPRFTARRVSVVRFDAADLDALTVSVIPRSVSNDYVTRGAVARSIGVDVAIQKRLGDGQATVEEVDELVGYVEQIKAYLESKSMRVFADLNYLTLWKIEQDPLYYQAHLLEKNVFTAVLSLTYDNAEVI